MQARRSRRSWFQTALEGDDHLKLLRQSTLDVFWNEVAAEQIYEAVTPKERFPHFMVCAVCVSTLDGPFGCIFQIVVDSPWRLILSTLRRTKLVSALA